MKTVYIKIINRTYFSKILDSLIALYINKRSMKNNLIRGQRMAIYANDWIGINVNLFGIYERDQLDALFGFLSPIRDILAEKIALDIGANIGNHSIFFPNFFSEVCAFEPNPSTYRLLDFNSTYCQKIRTFNFALGEREESSLMSEDAENFGKSSIVRSENGQTNIVHIHVKRLDDVCKNFSPIGLIKIDVEGYELNVLKGGLDVIRRDQPLVIFEQDISEFKEDCHETESIRLLKDLGYSFCWFASDSSQHGFLGRRLRDLTQILCWQDVREVIVADDYVPHGTYSMLLAVPRHLLGRLIGG